MGPRTASAFLVVTAILFAALLVGIAWRTVPAGSASTLLVGAVMVGLAVLALGVVFARGVGEGRL
jgi:hypothetical protein